jgi:hypothetical protein
MKISIYAPYAKERFETARQHSIFHPEPIVGNPEMIPRNVGEEQALPPQSNSVKTFVMVRAVPVPRSGKRLKICQFGWLRGPQPPIPNSGSVAVRARNHLYRTKVTALSRR